MDETSCPQAEPHQIPLHGRQGVVGYALVSVEDAQMVSAHRWWLAKNGYAVAAGPRPERKHIYMHRLITGALDGDRRVVVDHKNRDRLDNRRSNLRIVSQAENLANNASLGVSYRRGRRKPWYAHITRNYKTVWDGYFLTLEEAQEARSLAKGELK